MYFAVVLAGFLERPSLILKHPPNTTNKTIISPLSHSFCFELIGLSCCCEPSLCHSLPHSLLRVFQLGLSFIFQRRIRERRKKKKVKKTIPLFFIRIATKRGRRSTATPPWGLTCHPVSFSCHCATLSSGRTTTRKPARRTKYKP